MNIGNNPSKCAELIRQIEEAEWCGIHGIDA
jgi:hypothetical protein